MSRPVKRAKTDDKALFWKRIQNIPKMGPSWLFNRLGHHLLSRVGRYCLSLTCKKTDVLYAFYDLDHLPPSFVFPIFMVFAEIERKIKGCRSLHLVFLMGSRKLSRLNRSAAKDRTIINDRNYIWRIQHIALSSSWLIPSCRQFTMASRQEADLIHALKAQHVYPRGYTVDWPTVPVHLEPLLEARSRGIEIPSIRPSGKALEFIQKWMDSVPGNRKVVTINLREAPYWNARNSNLESWAAFARSLDPSVYYPVFIRDTYSALDPLPKELEGLNIFPEIPWHIDLRTALYEKSYLNLFVNNGPDTLALLNKNARYLIFKWVTPECKSTTVAYMKKRINLNPGDEWPGATPFQHLVWEGGDDLETIQREFAGMCEKIRTSDEDLVRAT